MIGNDIIDLELFTKETNWQRPKFLEKIFTKKEQSQILQSEEPEILVAILWAMKEACYKAHQRRFSLPRKYNPFNFDCAISKDSDRNKLYGTIQTAGERYHAEVLKTSAYIHCIVRPQNSEILQKLFEEEVHIFSELKSQYAVIKNLQEANLSIEKDENFIPHFFYNGVKEEVSFSISHHGKFSAFVLALMNS